MSNIIKMQNGHQSILILVDWFLPGFKAGGPIQSCANVAFALKEEYLISVLTTDTDYGDTEPYGDISPNEWSNKLDPIVYVYYAHLKTMTYGKLRKILQETDATYIYLNHMFSPKFVVYPLWLKWCGILKNDIVLCPRGALFENALSIKKYKKAPFLKVFKWMGIHKLIKFHATNEREKNAILKYFPGSRIQIADNLPNMNQPAYLEVNKTVGSLKCIFIARVHPIKNLYFLLQVLQQVKSKIYLTIIGPAEDKVYWQNCKVLIDELPVHIVIDYLGPVPNYQLVNFIQQHHLFVLPTSGENFGHAIFESFLAGRPVLISDQTPWQNLKVASLGWDLPLNEMQTFVHAIESAAAWDQMTFNLYAKASWKFAQKFISDSESKNKYLALFS